MRLGGPATRLIERYTDAGFPWAIHRWCSAVAQLGVVDYQLDTSHHHEGATVSILIASVTAPLTAAVLAAIFLGAMSGGIRIRTIGGQD